MFKSILVPLDGSPFSEHALPLASEIARRAGANLRLVHVHTPSSSPIYIEGEPVINENLASPVLPFVSKIKGASFLVQRGVSKPVVQ